MEVPERLHALVEKLGQAVVEALAQDPTCKEVMQEIQQEGFDAAIMMEASISLQHRDGQDAEEGKALRSSAPRTASSRELAISQPLRWSEEDRNFLKTFRISLD